jgi:hypothetical protein
LTVGVEVRGGNGTDFAGCGRKKTPTAAPTAKAGRVPSSLGIAALYPVPPGRNLGCTRRLGAVTCTMHWPNLHCKGSP